MLWCCQYPYQAILDLITHSPRVYVGYLIGREMCRKLSNLFKVITFTICGRNGRFSLLCRCHWVPRNCTWPFVSLVTVFCLNSRIFPILCTSSKLSLSSSKSLSLLSNVVLNVIMFQHSWHSVSADIMASVVKRNQSALITLRFISQESSDASSFEKRIWSTHNSLDDSSWVTTLNWMNHTDNKYNALPEAACRYGS